LPGLITAALDGRNGSHDDAGQQVSRIALQDVERGLPLVSPGQHEGTGEPAGERLPDAGAQLEGADPSSGPSGQLLADVRVLPVGAQRQAHRIAQAGEEDRLRSAGQVDAQQAAARRVFHHVDNAGGLVKEHLLRCRQARGDDGGRAGVGAAEIDVPQRARPLGHVGVRAVRGRLDVFRVVVAAAEDLVGGGGGQVERAEVAAVPFDEQQLICRGQEV
jgi:hypothetical protein